MAMIDRIQTAAARLLFGAKASDLPAVPEWQRVSFDAPSFSRMTREGYTANAAVYACIRALQFAFPEAPMDVLDMNDEPQPDHPLQKLLRKPNDTMSESELALHIITYLAIGGNCYLYKVREGGRQDAVPRNGRPGAAVKELYAYHTGQITPVLNSGGISHYEYDSGDTKKSGILKENIIHLKWPSIDPEQPWLAIAPLRAVAQEVDTDSEATRFMYALLRNDATPRTIINTKAQLNDGTFERLRQQFTQRHGGANRGNVGIVEGDATISRLSLDLQELDMSALRNVPEARICAAFGVPPEVAGLSVGMAHSTENNLAAADRRFTNRTIVPIWVLVADEITQDLGADFGGGVVVRHDLSRVASLQENENDRYARAINVWDKGIVTRNEVRRMLGLPDVEALQLPPGAEPLPPGDTFKGGAPAPAPAPEMIDLSPTMPMLTDGKAYTPALLALKDNSTTPIERRLRDVLTPYLLEQYEKAARAIEGA